MRMAAARSHWLLKGTAQHIADQLEEWFVNDGADGFNLLPQILPGSLNDFVDLVIPELQRRGSSVTEYEGRIAAKISAIPRPVSTMPRPKPSGPCSNGSRQSCFAIQSAMSGRTLKDVVADVVSFRENFERGRTAGLARHAFRIFDRANDVHTAVDDEKGATHVGEYAAEQQQALARGCVFQLNRPRQRQTARFLDRRGKPFQISPMS